MIEAAAVVVERAFGLIDAIGNFLDDLAHGAIGLIPDAFDAGFHRGAAVALDQLAIAARAELAGSHLRSEIPKARIGEADIIVNDLPQGLVALALFVDFKRALLQAFGKNFRRQ